MIYLIAIAAFLFGILVSKRPCSGMKKCELGDFCTCLGKECFYKKEADRLREVLNQLEDRDMVEQVGEFMGHKLFKVKSRPKPYEGRYDGMGIHAVWDDFFIKLDLAIEEMKTKQSEREEYEKQAGIKSKKKL